MLHFNNRLRPAYLGYLLPDKLDCNPRIANAAKGVSVFV